MATITRSDSTQFVIQAYREQVNYRKKSEAQTRIRSIAEQQGHFVRLFKNQSDELEAVFSTEPGYLLGESIRQHYSQTKNLIFCEKLNDSNQSLLVVIKQGHVFTDTLIDNNQAQDELLPLLALKTPFQIITTKESPLTNDPELQTETRYCFPPEHTTSFEYLDSPLLPQLPTTQKVQLLPLQLALKTQGLSKNPLFNTVLSLGVLFCVLLGVMFLATYKNSTTQKKLNAPHQINPYAAYDAALLSPAPSAQLATLLTLLNTLYQIPGWELTQFSQHNNLFVAHVKTIGANLSTLRQFANQSKLSLEIKPNGIVLKQTMQTPRRTKPSHLYSLAHMSEALLDTLSHSLLGISVSLINTTQHGRIKSNLFQLNLKESTPEELKALQKILIDLPAVLTTADFRVNSDGLFNGSIKISLWGE